MFLKGILLFLGIILLILVMSFFGLGQIINNLLSANIFVVFLALLVQLAILGVLSSRLWYICKKYAVPYVSFSKSMKISIIGWTINMLTPITKIGGEPAKIYLFKKHGMRTTDSSAVVLLDSFTDIVSMFFVLIFALFAMLVTNVLPFRTLLPFIAISAITLLMIILLFIIILHPIYLKKIVDWLVFKISKRRQIERLDYAGMFQKAVKILLQDKKLMMAIFGLSFILRFLEFLRLWLVFLALGSALPFYVVVFAWSIILVLSMIPWLPGGLGLLEGGGAYSFILFGVSAGVAGSGMIIDRLLSFWFVILLGFVIAWRMHIHIDPSSFKNLIKYRR